jgi:hypothetical protein
MQTPPNKERDITPDILSLKTTRAFWRQNTFTFNKPAHLVPKYFEHFIGSAPPLSILDPLLWIGSAYVSLYKNSCFGLNKALTNLTLLRQHHLQYIMLMGRFLSGIFNARCTLIENSLT